MQSYSWVCSLGNHRTIGEVLSLSYLFSVQSVQRTSLAWPNGNRKYPPVYVIPSWRSLTARVQISSAPEINSAPTHVAKAVAAMTDKVNSEVVASDQPSESSLEATGTSVHVSTSLLCDPTRCLQLCR